MRVMDAALVLHAEHGMNASTFAARVTAATLADMHAADHRGLRRAQGPAARRREPGRDGAAARAAATPTTPRRRSARCSPTGQKVPGFGHRVYRTFDPRATFLRKMSKQLGEAAGNTKWYEMSERLIPIVKDSSRPRASEEPQPQRRFLLRQRLLHDGHPARPVHPDLRASPASPAGPPT